MNEFLARNGLIALDSSSISGTFIVTGSSTFNGNVTLLGNISYPTFTGNIQTGNTFSFYSSNGVISAGANLSINIGPTGTLSINKTNNITSTSGEINWIYVNPPISRAFMPTSGTATMNGILLNLPINQTGDANGITRGINIVPTLTSAWDFRAIEWTNNASATSGSWGLYGAGSAPNYLSGSLSIGTTGSTTPLYVRSNAAVSSVLTLEAGSSQIAYSFNGSRSGFTYAGNHGAFFNPIFGFTSNNVQIGIGNADAAARLHVRGESASTGTALLIQNSTPSNLLTVLNNGNVGIGTITPNAKLDVSGSAIISGSLTATQGITGSLFGTSSWSNNAVTASFIPTESLSSNFFAQGGNSFATTALLGTNDAQSLALETNGSTRMFISGSNGYVGLGTSAPTYSLDIAGSTGNDGVIRARRIITTGGTASDPPITTNSTIAGLFEPTYANLGFSSYGGEAGRIETISRYWNIGMTGGTAKFNIRGSGSSAVTNALVVQNSSGTTLLRVRDDGATSIGAGNQGLDSPNASFTQYLISTGTFGNVFGTYTSFTPSAMVEINSTTRGFLTPRMTEAQRLAISNPAQGLMVYDTGSATEGLWFYNSGSNPGWQEVLTNSGSQSISGSITANSITVTGTLTAQTIVAQTITSSTDYVSGSTIFGNLIANTHQFTGSVSVTGSSRFVGNTTIIGSTNTGGTNALVVQNSAGSTALSVTNGLTTIIHGDLQLENTVIYWNGGTQIRNTSNGILRICDSTATDFTRLQFGGTTTAFPALQRSGSALCVVDGTGGSLSNFLIGGIVDSSQRLQVYGDTLMKGSGATSATNALTVQDSVGNSYIRAVNSQMLEIGTTDRFQFSSGRMAHVTSGGSISNFQIVGGNIAMQYTTINIGTNSYTSAVGFADSWTRTTAAQSFGSYVSFSPTSGTSAFASFVGQPAISQSGGANGITRGLYVNPTLTSAFDWRSIEWSNNTGWGLYGAGTAPNYLAGRLAIGTTNTSSAILTVEGNVSASSFTGSLFGTSSWSRNAITASSVNTLNQNVIIVNALAIGTSSLGSNENTLVLGLPPAGGIGEGGQILLQASGGLYTSASMLDNWQNYTRLLRGTNAGSDAVVTQWNMHTKQISLPAYNNASSFPGTATANLAVNSNGDVITVSTSGGTVFPYTGNAVITGSLTVTQPIYAQPNGGMYFQGGDDAALYDINLSNHIGIYGVQDSTVGSIKLGSNGGIISGRDGNIGIGTTTPNARLDVSGSTRFGILSSNTHQFTGSVNITGSLLLNGLPISSTTGQIILTAGGGWPSITSGSNAPILAETTTNRVNYYYIGFPDTIQTFANWSMPMPSDYNGGTITAVFYWAAGSASTNSVDWGLAARAYADSDALDQAFGTAQEITDANQANDDVNISAPTPAITIGGTPAAGNFVQFRAYRNPADVNDTLAATAKLLSIRITYTRA